MRRKRWMGMGAVGGAAAVAVGAALGALGLLAGAPEAEAAGLDALCQTGTGLNPIPTSLVFEGDAITGEHSEFDTFPTPLPMFATPGADGAPVFGPGNMHSIDLNTDGQSDLEFGIGLRSATGGSPLDPLMAENFGFAPGTALAGLDLLVQLPSGSWIDTVPQGRYAASVGLRLERTATGPDGRPVLVDYLDVQFRIDSLQAAARDANQVGRFPDEVRMSLATKDPDPANNDVVFWAAGQQVSYGGAAGSPKEAPPLDTGVTVSRAPLDGPDGPVAGTAFLDARLGWDRTPAGFAVGIGQTCPSGAPGGPVPVAHYASNLPDSGTGTTGEDGRGLAIDVRSGIGAGTGGGDELRFAGRIDDLPNRIDVVDLDRTVDLVRSPDRSPTLRLDRLDLAADDPDVENDEATHVHGLLEGLPAQVRLTLDRAEGEAGDGKDGSQLGAIEGVELKSCPAFDDTDLLWFFLPSIRTAVDDTGHVDGCVAPEDDPGAAKVRNAHVVVQNFVPGGILDGNPSGGLLGAPPPARQAGTISHYEQKGPDRPWELVTEPVREVERTTFFLAALQRPYGPLNDSGLLLMRAGADVRDLDEVRFDMTEGSRRPDDVDPGDPDDDRSTYGPHDVTTVSAQVADEPFAQVKVQLDRRTDGHTDPESNTEPMVAAIGVLTPLPGPIEELSFEALGAGVDENMGDEVPVRLAWDLSAPTELYLGHFDLLLPGLDARTGEGLSALAASGEARLELPEQGTAELAEQTSTDGGRSETFSYEPGDDPFNQPGDGQFPPLRAALAVEASTAADREAGHTVKLVADARVTEPLAVVLRRGADDDLLSAGAVACEDEATCDNEVHLDAVYSAGGGAPTISGGLTVSAPSPTPTVPARQPMPNDVTVVLDGADYRWGVGVDLRDLPTLGYEAEIEDGYGDICVETGLDAPMTVRMWTPGAWFDGRLSDVPDHTRLRFVTEDRGDSDFPVQPWLWLDTTSCDTAHAPVTETEPDAGPGPDHGDGRPVLDATAVFTSQSEGTTSNQALYNLPAPPGLPPADGTPGHPTAASDGFAAHVETGPDDSTAAVVAARVHVPDHLLVWRPETTCTEREGLPECGSMPWQHADHRVLGLKVQSTRASLGSLVVTGHLDAAAPGDDYQIAGMVPELPGSLDLDLSASSSAGLAWQDILLDLDASTQVGDVHLSADNLTATNTGYVGDAAGPNQTPVPEYALGLYDVGDDLHATIRTRDGDDPNRGRRVGDEPGEPVCPGRPDVTRRGKAALGYLHADIELDGTHQFGQSAPAESLVINSVNAQADPRTGAPPQQLVTVHTDQPIEAEVRARIDNLVVYQNPDPINPIDRDLHIFLLPALVDLFAGDTTFEACLDFDLPVELTLTDTTTAQLANTGMSFAIDADTAPGANVELRVGETQPGSDPAAQPGDPGGPTWQAGVPFAHRSVSFHPTAHGDRDESVGTPHWKDTPAIQVDPGTDPATIAGCHNNAVPYHPGLPVPGSSLSIDDMLTGPVTTRIVGRDGSNDADLNRSTMLLELLWSSSERSELRDDDLGPVLGCPGVELYSAIARSGSPPVSLPVGRLDWTLDWGFEQFDAGSAEFTMTNPDLQPAGDEFCSMHGWDTSAARRPGWQPSSPTYPEAVGPDGTTYSLHVWTYDNNQTYCMVNLVARHPGPGGAVRWSRAIVANDLPLSPVAWRNAQWRVRILPYEDGSVEVQIHQDDLGGGFTYDSSYVARLDSAGRGFVHRGVGPGQGAVLALLAGPAQHLDVPDVAQTGPCLSGVAAAGSPGPERTRIWYFGDGTSTETSSTVPSHCYARPGRYFVHYVDYAPGGQATTGESFTVTIPPP